MNRSSVTVEGLKDAQPGRDAPPGSGRPTGRASSERQRLKGRRLNGGGLNGGGLNGERKKKRPVDQPGSYYGLPVINKPVWKAQEIAGYFFLGGLAGASSCLGAVAQLSGRPSLARTAKVGAASAGLLSLAALVKDLGRPARFLNMLRVFKPTSPMSVGTWLLGGYVPAAMAAAVSDLTGAAPLVGTLTTAGAAVLGPAVASYTAVLISDTAVPAWHDAHRHMPFIFVASAGMAAAGLGLLCAREGDVGPARRLAVLSAAGELGVDRAMQASLHPAVVKAYEGGKAHNLLRWSKVLAVMGAVGSVAGRRCWAVRRVSGAALVAASACTRFGVFYAGMASAEDPLATITPQKQRLEGARAS